MAKQRLDSHEDRAGDAITSWDAIIVGGGAAGLVAAASAAGRGRRTLLLEKNHKLGVKILMSGGTRCNITHACDRREVVSAFGRNGKFLHSSLAVLPPEAVVQMVEKAGVATKVESTGKVFPVSDRAIEVRDALVKLARQAGATILTGSPVEAIAPGSEEQGGFVVTSADNRWRSESLLVTTGGKSYPGCGTTGDGYAWAKQFGHSIVDLRPALTPIVSHTPWVHELKGIALEGVKTSVVRSHTSRTLASSDAPTLLTHFGFSGPGAMNVSGAISAVADPKALHLEFNLFPETNPTALFEHFRSLKNDAAGEGADVLLQRRFPKRVTMALLQACNLAGELRLAELSKKQLVETANKFCSLRIPVHGTLGYRKAEVTAGGVALNEVNGKTMQSKLQPGLFFAGEILDLDGPIGGFNFQSAFSTGWLAGQGI